MNIPTFDEWLSEHGDEVEKEYQIYHEVYGDAMNCILSDYKEQKYNEFIEKQKYLDRFNIF